MKLIAVKKVPVDLFFLKKNQLLPSQQNVYHKIIFILEMFLLNFICSKRIPELQKSVVGTINEVTSRSCILVHP